MAESGGSAKQTDLPPTEGLAETGRAETIGGGGVAKEDPPEGDLREIANKLASKLYEQKHWNQDFGAQRPE